MDNSYIISDEQLKKAQHKMLDMLVCFKAFCEKYNLMFYLHGGAAIGAVREHGFVPWDDDIDILMPRPDYEKFCILWEKYGDKEKYKLCRTNKDINYHHYCASLRDPNTTFICSYNIHSNICHGIALEFGPIDACPSNIFQRIWQIFNAFIFALFNAQRLPSSKGQIIRFVTWLVYKLIKSQKIKYKLWKFAEKQVARYSWKECKYVTELTGSIKVMFRDYPKEWFDSVVYFDFCGYEIPLMKGYDQYLKGIFGNYMLRPSKENQVAKHDLVFADMDHPYTDYKNIYYFPEGK